jgi:hypothetical protein
MFFSKSSIKWVLVSFALFSAVSCFAGENLFSGTTHWWGYESVLTKEQGLFQQSSNMTGDTTYHSGTSKYRTGVSSERTSWLSGFRKYVIRLAANDAAVYVQGGELTATLREILSVLRAEDKVDANVSDLDLCLYILAQN